LPTIAVPLARAILEGGLPVIEPAVRTSAAWEAITRIAAKVPETLVARAQSSTTAEPTRPLRRVPSTAAAPCDV